MCVVYVGSGINLNGLADGEICDNSYYAITPRATPARKLTDFNFIFVFIILFIVFFFFYKIWSYLNVSYFHIFYFDGIITFSF